MFLLAALLCNYGRGKCLIDIGTEGRVDGSIGQFLLKLARIDVLLLDDFAMAPLKDQVF